jgi:tetratricopeptide (TPR) repeat protein
MHNWTPFNNAGEFDFDGESLRNQWNQLHAGDREPLPKDDLVLSAWAHFHNGAFQKAYETGLQCGPAGLNVAHKSACMYATYIEPREKDKQDLYLEVSERAAVQAKMHPELPSAHYWQAYALGRYSQGVSVAKALAQGIGSRVKHALETTIQLEPRHAEAHIALGVFHAEVIDKVGILIGNMTYGAKKETSLKLFQQGLLLTPKSPIAMMEYANSLVMLEGDKREADATRLYEKAVAIKPLDAKERLEVDLARAELAG